MFVCLSECIPLVNVDFKADHIINLSQQIYIQVNNVIKVLFETSDSSYGFFNGRSSSIQIPRLDSVALPRLQIELRFLMSPATTSSISKYQVLASNCHSKAKPWDLSEVTQDLTPSLAIIADTVNQQLLFLAYSDDLNVKPVKIYLPYEVSVFRKRYRGILIISESELKSNQTWYYIAFIIYCFFKKKTSFTCQYKSMYSALIIITWYFLKNSLIPKDWIKLLVKINIWNDIYFYKSKSITFKNILPCL